MNIAPYRSAYFALCHRLGLDDALRHEFQRALTGRASTREWAVADWRRAVAELQRQAGQDVRPDRPRIRSRGNRDHGHDAPITAAQLEFLTALAEKIPWRVSAESFIRSRLLHPFRRDAWDGQLSTLRGYEAAAAITAIKRMAEKAAVPA